MSVAVTTGPAAAAAATKTDAAAPRPKSAGGGSAKRNTSVFNKMLDCVKKGDLVGTRRLMPAVNVNGSDARGLTALHWASYYGHVDIIQCLVKYHCDMNLKEKIPQTGWTPLQYACDRGHYDAVRELLKHGARTDVTAHDGRTALSVAAARKHMLIGRMLLDHNVPPRLEDVDYDVVYTFDETRAKQQAPKPRPQVKYYDD